MCNNANVLYMDNFMHLYVNEHQIPINTYENCQKCIRTEVGPGCVNTTISVILVTILKMIAILIQLIIIIIIIIIIIMQMHVLDDYLQIQWTSY